MSRRSSSSSSSARNFVCHNTRAGEAGGPRIAAAATATLSASGLFNQTEGDIHSNFKAIAAKLQSSSCINNVNIEQARKLNFRELSVCRRAH
jgi:hypothetical protein